MHARPPSTLLQQLIQQREVSYEQLVRELADFARLATSTRRSAYVTCSDWPDRALEGRDAAGGSAGNTSSAAGVLRILLRRARWSASTRDANPPVLFVPAAADTRAMVARAAAVSLDFLTSAENDRVPPAVLDHISSELRRIAVDYVHRPLPPLFLDLVELRDHTFRLLRERPHPQQARQLFFVAGTVCTLLAHASQNMGYASAARTQAQTAWACADQADHTDLRAWVRGTQALIAEWTDAHAEAIAFTQQGELIARSTESKVRLAAIRARTHARAGDAGRAIEAVEQATQYRDAPHQPDSLAEFGGC